MMKMNKKGFTIVELVIVIAVIAILAAVMIPTFSGIVTKAQQSAAIQKATAMWKELYALDLADGNLNGAEGSTDIVKTNTKYQINGVTNFEYTPNATGTKFTAQIDSRTVTFDGTTWSST